MKILVTGGNGFIGSHLVERLLREKHKVKVLLRKRQSNRQNKESTKFLSKLNVYICYGDLSDKESLEKAVKGVDAVFHLAGIASTLPIPRKTYFLVNSIGTKNLLDACRKNKKIKKIIIMSSIAAAGPSRNGIIVNEKTECKPIDAYGESKLEAEKISIKYFKKYKLPIVMLRPGLVFGPRDFMKFKLFKAVKKRFFPVSSEKKIIDFLYVGNLIEACLLALNGKNGEIYHISDSRLYSINEIIGSIEKAEKIKVLPIKFPSFSFVVLGGIIEFFGKIFGFRPVFKHNTTKWMTTKYWYSDISKAKKEIGYVGKIPLDEGIKRTFEYYKNNGFL